MSSSECRICLRYELNCVSLFAKRRGTKLAEIIRFCARIEISEDDGLPGDACARCVVEALNAYLFVNKCRRSDAELRTAQATCKDGSEEDQQIENPNSTVRDDIESELKLSSELGYEDDILLDDHMSEKVSNSLGPSDSATEIRMDDNAIPIIYDHSVQQDALATCEETELHEIQLQFPLESKEESEPSDEYVLDVKQEIAQCSDEEGDQEFLVEYLEDDFKSDVLIDENSEYDQEMGMEIHEEVKSDSNETSCTTSMAPKRFMCCGARCRAVFDTQEELLEHSEQKHFPHRKCKSSKKPFECKQCFSHFSTEKKLLHHSSKSTECTLCSQMFSSLKQQRLHMHKVHGHPDPEAENNSQKKICCGCYQSFDSDMDLRLHTEQQHSIRKSAVDDTRPLQCNVCYKRFRTAESLRIHQRFVYRPKNFVCTACSRAFDTHSKLITHQLVHSNERKFKCDKCVKSFKKEIDLKSHSLLHEEKQEMCTVCGLRFHRKSNLKMHMRKHQDTFFYACSDCPKQFKNHSHLNEHYKVHSKQKPYDCRYCEKSFAYFSDRKRHEMTHTGKYPFECICSKKFARKTTFQKHTDICQESMDYEQNKKITT
ncbi:zinc finger protein 846-like [Toxorhynchites rutilus septentrionalis]|uniref:zinc finger protein 846-like n=1 Tax=Toxorhynchites rutilus septentrionalis TaxID=329112 RepID=UPI0024787759|nr:zinc finger protein 846-like [Toxorhynchites rutilus septentrionalis]XP_055638629.1 zinc finger protein 846-like [Toxorhynchites rutilus septentrionalis]XP_055638630.1 zinc finger protein 846-like [Toxorhynchites rutilus septentrionalis]